MDSIKSLAASSTYQENRLTNQAQMQAFEQSRDLEQKLDDDVQFMKYHTGMAKELNTMPRVKLESSTAKLERLKGLYAAGIVRDKNFKKSRLMAALKRITDAPVVSGETQVMYD